MLNIDAKRCIQSLPPAMKKALYNQVGQGYEKAMSRALEFLEIGTFIDPPVVQKAER